MRKPAFQKAARGRQVASEYSLPAPVGGWNARDSVADMDEKDAVKMVNWFPETTDVRVRKGSADHVTGIGAQVESLMPYNSPDGTKTLFAAAGTAIYNVTSAGAVGGAVVSGTTNARWNHVNYTNSGGTSYLCNFNGEDSPEYWDGSSWTTITGASTPAITGLTTSDIFSATVFKRRLWLVEKDSLKAWYLPIDSVGGLAKAFDLSGICKRGGYLMAMGTWTLDSGEGIDDLLVGVTSEGQVVVAKGTDPSSASTWGLVGVWDVGEPLGRRCLTKYKGDLLYASIDGVYALSTALIGSRADPQDALTYKINKAVATATLNDRANFGWELFHYPLENMLMLNVPISEGSNQEQYTMNTITGSWGQFMDLSANCWAFLNDEAYFGTNGEVVKFGGTNFGDNSTNIDTDMQQAFSYFGERGRMKHFLSMRPNMLINSSVSILMDITTDFSNEAPTSGLSLSPITEAVWDTGVWDTGLWSGDVFLSNPWLTVHGVGTSGSPRLITASQADIRLQATDHVFEFGGVIG